MSGTPKGEVPPGGDGLRAGHARGARRHPPLRLRRDVRGPVPHARGTCTTPPRRPRRRSPARSTTSSTRATATRRSRCSRTGCGCSRAREACFATATGMAAVFNSMAAFLTAGDRVVASRALFGSCFVILDELLPRWGITTRVRRRPRPRPVARGARDAGAGVFFESPSNPMQDLVDVRGGVRARARGRGARRRRQRVRDAAAAAAAGAGRRHRRLLGDQAHRRPGPRAGRRDPRVEGVHRRRGADAHAAHRPVDEPVQRVGAAQGPRDDAAAGRAPERGGAAAGAVAGGARRRPHRPLPAPAEPPAVRPGQAADVRRRLGGDVRAGRRRRTRPRRRRSRCSTRCGSSTSPTTWATRSRWSRTRRRPRTGG